MKKIIYKLLFIVLLFPYFLISRFNNYSEVVNASDNQPKVTTSISAYYATSKYSGPKTSTTLKASDILEVSIVDKGGVHLDGDSIPVFSNYAIVTINYKIDGNHKVLNKDTYILSDSYMDVSGDVYGSDENVKLPTKVGYGQLFVSYDTRSYGRREFTNVAISGGTTQRLHFTEDGDYHLVSIFYVKENGDKKKLVIETTLSVRTSIYLTDLSGVYQVKDRGMFYNPFIVDANKRDNVTIYCNDKVIQDGTVIQEDGTYTFKVYGNGFFAECFKFEKFENIEIAELYISNIRKKLGNNSYEAENYFSCTWQENYSLEAYITNLDDNIRKSYIQETIVDVPGIYKVELYNSWYARTMIAYVNLVAGDNPTQNYDTLSSNRFNNFKTKWYEVYDDENDDYLCFDLREYSTAFNAALSIENKKVVEKGYEKVYKNVSYNDSIELTKALNENAEKNIKIQYYDFEDSTKSKLFSVNLFEEIIYLNDDFVFVKSHSSETNSVLLTHIETNKQYNIDYFVEIGTYNLLSGKYEVKEQDLYGNETVYEAYYDNEAPEIKVDIDGESRVINNGDVIYADYFFIDELYDELDSYAVVSVNEEYFINNEFYKEVFNQNGVYNIRAYDRNNNFIKCTIIIEKDSLYTVDENEYSLTFVLKENVSVVKVLKNDVEIELEGLTFEKETENIDVYFIYLKNNLNNHEDCIKFETSKKAQNNNAIIDDNNKNEGISMAAAILISSSVFVVFTALGVVLFIMNKKEEK